ncbi:MULTISPECIES: VIT domain-containing protein [unclassified Coleofasciculus]|uniref:VIT domain-containing protein n=1 Tax=unclassified Coleofasciculus TaxID=2692782 RepID=UPI00188103B7|nr:MULTISPECIES: VIT domain-containing protein [unclassified Coleofasciculus]MBE9127899.1 after-VIT domain-containing protein [Coleofasciculus sp. LEGE 07081]MBE9148064.1 after-VIT domain-containing protein [Coleofasciculus sp. LEGE 07092]
MSIQSCHLLIIEDNKGRKVCTLTEPVYSMGRDSKCDIRILSQFVNRRHATLIRQVRDNGSYCYQIVDGDANGKLSANGLLINGKKCKVHHLQDEDKIMLSPDVSVNYYILRKDPDSLVRVTRNTKNTRPTMPSYPPKLGGLYVKSSEVNLLVFPLKHTEVQAKVTGNVSRLEVTQTFENPFSTTLEATYIFPLPDEAAVDDMEIRIGDRIIKGNIKKRQEAVAIYEQAKKRGRTAGLLEQERDNIFTQSLANIKPGEQIDVIIRYTDSLKFNGGNYDFVFPMVVGPRYIPGTTIDENIIGGGSAPAPMTLNQDTDLVPDASRLNAPILPPGARSGHDITVTVEIDAGVEIKDMHSPSHQIQIEREGHRMRVTLSRRDTIPNKDFILRYQVAGDRTQTTVLSEFDERGGHFAVYLIPAIEYNPDQFVPKDMVFVIDTSGSQSGEPLRKCQELMRRFINELNPDDTFSIIDFSDTTRQLSPLPLSNTVQNRNRAMNYINQLNASGGTQMLRGIQVVLNFPEVDPGRLRSIVLLTDGYIGNENQILAEVQSHLKLGNRLHSFGAGSSVNRFLLNRIAEIGRGISQIIRYDEPTEQVVEQFFRQINNPVLTNIQLYWAGDGEPPIIYPATPPDLFAEQPLVLFGRKSDALPGMLEVTGTVAGGECYQQTFDLNFEDTGNPAIAQLWGRARIKDLTNQMLKGETKVGVDAVTDTALTYQLLSQYTAFVAVSDEVRVNPWEPSVSVQVPVEMPEGVSYEGIFGDVARSALPEVDYAFEDYSEPDEFDLTLISPDMMADADTTVLYSPPPAKAPKRKTPTSPPPAAPSRSEQSGVFGGFMGNSKKSAHRLKIISLTGLDQVMIARVFLTKHLQSIKLPSGVSGELVFEFFLSKGRVSQVALDEQASSVKDREVTAMIRRALLLWLPPQSESGIVHLRVRIKP